MEKTGTGRDTRALSLMIYVLAPLIYLPYLYAKGSRDLQESLLILVLATAPASIVSARLALNSVTLNLKNLSTILIVNLTMLLLTSLSYRPLGMPAMLIVSAIISIQAAQHYGVSLLVFSRLKRRLTKSLVLLLYFLILPILVFLQLFGYENLEESEVLGYTLPLGLFYPGFLAIAVERVTLLIGALLFALLIFAINISMVRILWGLWEPREPSLSLGYRKRDLIVALGVILLIIGLSGLVLQVDAHYHRSLVTIPLAGTPIAYTVGNNTLAIVQVVNVDYVGRVPYDPGELVELKIDWNAVNNCRVYILNASYARISKVLKPEETLDNLLKRPEWLQGLESSLMYYLRAYNSCKAVDLTDNIEGAELIVLIGEKSWEEVKLWLTIWKQYESYWHPDGEIILSGEQAKEILLGLTEGKTIEEITGKENFKSWRADLLVQLIEIIPGKVVVRATYKHKILNETSVASIFQILTGLILVLMRFLDSKTLIKKQKISQNPSLELR